MTRFRALLSYHYFKDVDLGALAAKLTVNGERPDIFVDSGAFSAASLGATIDLDAYAAWLHKWREVITVYATLDVIGNAAATRENTRVLETMDLAPLPVFHFGGALTDLAALTERYRYIALGGMVGRALPLTMKFVAACFAQTDQTRTVFHGFGVTSTRMLMNFPWYSVDSSSWGSAYRFGTLKAFDQRRGTWSIFKIRSRAGWLKHGWVCQQYGVKAATFVDDAQWHHSHAAALSAQQYLAAEAWLRRRWGIVSLPVGAFPTVRTGGEGLNLYLVDGAPANLGYGAQRGLNLYLAMSIGEDIASRADAIVRARTTTPTET